jgi:hypothetical protein
LRIENLTTSTFADGLFASEQLATRGLFSHTLGDVAKDPGLWRAAQAAAKAAGQHNRRGRGDVLEATLVADSTVA